MKFFFDLLPVILFFTAYQIAGKNPDNAAALTNNLLGGDISPSLAPIFIATAITMLATILQISLIWLRYRKVEKMLWISLIIIMVFGGATLFFQNPTFIKWKPTVLYWLFGIVLTSSSLIFKRNLIQKMLEGQITLPPPVWSRLNFMWVFCFTLLGALNIYIAYHFSEQTWVNFKMFGTMGIMFTFVVAQVFYLSKYIKEDTH